MIVFVSVAYSGNLDRCDRWLTGLSVGMGSGCSRAMNQMAVLGTVRASVPISLRTGSGIELLVYLHFGPWNSRVFVGALIAYAIVVDASAASTTLPTLRTQTRML